MTPATILADLAAQGISCRIDEARNLRVTPASSLTPELRTLLVENKPALVKELEQDARRREVLRMLEASPEIERAHMVDGTSDPVRVVIAIRGIGTAELVISQAKFDPFLFLELLEQHGGTG